MLDEKRKEFSNMTESQAREKFVSKASAKLGEDQANEIADQVIPKLKERGIIKPDPGRGSRRRRQGRRRKKSSKKPLTKTERDLQE